jgi:hypothetical protein
MTNNQTGLLSSSKAKYSCFINGLLNRDIRNICRSRTEIFEDAVEIERLFQSLPYQIDEKPKLSILKRNMKAPYKHTLALADIDSLKKLELYCGRLDAVDVNITAMGTGQSRQKQTYTRIQMFLKLNKRMNHRAKYQQSNGISCFFRKI